MEISLDWNVEEGTKQGMADHSCIKGSNQAKMIFLPLHILEKSFLELKHGWSACGVDSGEEEEELDFWCAHVLNNVAEIGEFEEGIHGFYLFKI